MVMERDGGKRLLWPLPGEVAHMSLGEVLREGAGADVCSTIWISGRVRRLSELEERRLC